METRSSKSVLEGVVTRHPRPKPMKMGSNVAHLATVVTYRDNTQWMLSPRRVDSLNLRLQGNPDLFPVVNNLRSKRLQESLPLIKLLRNRNIKHTWGFNKKQFGRI